MATFGPTLNEKYFSSTYFFKIKLLKGLHLPHIKALKQPSKLFWADTHHGFSQLLWPWEAFLL
jgi:hypothetical protein